MIAKKFFIILILLPLSGKLNSQTQHELRKEHPLNVSAGFSNFSLLRGGNVSMSYEIFGNLTLGASVIYNDSYHVVYQSSLFYDLKLTPCTGGELCDRYSSYQKYSGGIFLSYFPFNGMLYININFMKYPDGNEKFTSRISPCGNSVCTSPSTVFTIDSNQNKFISLGIGWKWESKNNLFFKLDIGVMKDRDTARKLYAYTDSRGLLPGSYVPDPLTLVKYYEARIPTHSIKGAPYFTIGLGFAM